MKKALSLFLSIVLVLGVFLSVPFTGSPFNITAEAASGNEIVAYARQFLGYPYVWGTQGPNSFDCSGFVQYVFKHFGISLPASTTSYWNNPEYYGTVIATGSTANAVAGDIISWPGHVAIYTENGYCIEALNPTYGVCDTVKVDAHIFDYPTSNYRVLRINGVTGGASVPVCVSIDKTQVPLWTDATFSFSNVYASSLHFYIYKGTELYFQGEFSPTQTYTRQFGETGHYSCYIVAHNANGDVESNWLGFDVIEKPVVLIDKSETTLWTNTTFTFSNVSASSLHFYIYKGTELYFQGEFSPAQTYTRQFGETGHYSCYIVAHNASGDVESNWLGFDVVNNSYTITFNANGGTGAPSSQTKTYGQTLTLSSTKPTRSGYTFLGWSTSSSATKATYSAGGSFNTDADTTLYAVWSKNHSHSYTGTVTKAPTCTQTGIRTYKCSCGASYTQTISATGHTASSWITDKAATVNAAGSQHKECTKCGEVLETAVIPQLKPSDPTLSKATNANGGVTVTWKAVSGADSYRVYRKTSSSGWTCLNSKVTSTSYTDKTAKSGTTYYYTVRAENEGGLSGYNSTGVSVKYLAMPTVKIANAATGVKVSWNKITGASKYCVYRKASGEKSWTRLTDSATGTSYTDKKAKSGTTYYYTVKAVSGSVSSAYKSSSALKYLAQPKVSSLSNTNSGITVKWGKITGASGYYVYRKTGSGSWSLIYTVKSGSTVSYTDKSAKAGTTYYYTVRAYSGSVKSTYTSSSAIRRLTTPTLKSVSSAKSGITFKWNKVTGASGYYVYRKTGSGGWKKIDTVKSGSTVSYLDKTAKKGTTYTYTVKAYYSSSSVSYFNTTGLKIKDKY